MRRHVLTVAWPVWIALVVAQTVLSFFLVRPGASEVLRVLGWAIGFIVFLLNVATMSTLRRFGRIGGGQAYTETTVSSTAGSMPSCDIRSTSALR